MIEKEYLDNYEKRMNNYEYEIKKINKNLNIEHNRVTSDTVQGSSKRFPYVKRNIGISGYNSKRMNQLKNRLKIYEKKKNKLKRELQYKIDNLEDRQIADIIEKKYIEKNDWKQIASKIGYADESGPRLSLKRYFIKK